MTLLEAINQSCGQTERVAVEFAGTCDTLISELYDLIDSDTQDIDYTTENDGTIDVWAYDPEADASSMIWRLCVNLVDAEESDAVETQDIGDGFFEAADGTVIYSPE